MLKRVLSLLFLVFALSGGAFAQQSMTDQQVLEYVRSGIQQGKSQRQIATELARRGVTQEQAVRVKKLYEQQTETDEKGTIKQSHTRLRDKNKEDENEYIEKRRSFYPNINLAIPSNYRLEPGCEIIVPSKTKNKNMGNALTIASSIGSLGMMIATIANLIK